MNWNNIWQENHLFRVENNKFKRKRMVALPYVKVNKEGFSDADVRDLILADSIARFFRCQGENVLFAPGFDTLAYTAFLEAKVRNNSLNEDLSNYYLEDMKSLNIGYADNKLVMTRSKESLLFLEQVFLYFYELGLIKRVKRPVKYLPNTSKYYDINFTTFRGDIRDKEVFIFDFSQYEELVRKILENLPIDQQYKDELSSYLKEEEIVKINLYLSEDNVLAYETSKPEFLGGLVAIMINPDYVDFLDYIAPEEIFAAEKFLTKRLQGSIYTGKYVTNPLSGQEIPLFLSYGFPEPFKYLNITNEEDLKVINQLEIDYGPILDDFNRLINSDFLDGMTPDLAHDVIIADFKDEGIAEIKKVYRNLEIVISSNDIYGCPIPLMTNGKESITLANNLPLTYSNQFRVEIPEEATISQEYHLFKETLNSYFTSGLSLLETVLLEKNVELENILSESNILELESWLNDVVLIVKKDHIVPDLFLPFLFISILASKANTSLLAGVEVLISDVVRDTYGMEIKKDYNNYVKFSELQSLYTASALRLYFLDNDIKEKLYFNKDMIFRYKSILLGLKNKFVQGFSDNNFNLEFPTYKLKTEAYDILASLNMSQYVRLLLDFYENYLTKEKFTSKQALVYLKLLGVVCPEICEDLHYEYFSKKQLLADVEWPL